MKINRVVIILLSLLLSVSSCKKNDNNKKKKTVKKTNNILEKKDSLKLKVAKKNDLEVKFSEFPRSTEITQKVKLRYKFKENEERKIVHFLKMSMMYNAVLSEIDTKIYGSYKISKKLSNNKYSLTWKIERIIMNLKANNKELKYDSNLKENTLEQGKFLSYLVRGYITSDIDDLGVFSEMDLKPLFSLVGQDLNKDLQLKLKNKVLGLINASFILLPENDVKGAEEFLGRKDTKDGSNLEVSSIKKYLLKGKLKTNENILVLIPKVEIKAINDKQNIEIKSNKVDGWILFDKEKGQLRESYIHTKLNMIVNKVKMKMNLKSNFKILD